MIIVVDCENMVSERERENFKLALRVIDHIK